MNKGKLYGWVKSILIALVIALFIRQFIVEAFVIPSASMEPTLLVGDHILVNKFIYGIRVPFINSVIVPVSHPHVGDVVVFKFPPNPTVDFIKRCVGVPGDVLKMVNKQLYINGKPYHDKWAVFRGGFVCPKHVQPGDDPCYAPFVSTHTEGGGSRDNWGPIVVPKGEYFMMGDNRDNSYDSRYWGFVPSRDLLGEAFLIYGSWTWNPPRVRWSRFFKGIPKAPFK